MYGYRKKYLSLIHISRIQIFLLYIYIAYPVRCRDLLLYFGDNFLNQYLESFKSFVNDKAVVNGLVIYGAFDEDNLVGVLATKNQNGVVRQCIRNKWKGS